MKKAKNNSYEGTHDYNYKDRHSVQYRKRKVTDFRQLHFTFSIPGNRSIKHLSDREILARIERTKDPDMREKESTVGIPASLIEDVHIGLLEELNCRRIQNG